MEQYSAIVMDTAVNGAPWGQGGKGAQIRFIACGIALRARSFGIIPE